MLLGLVVDVFNILTVVDVLALQKVKLLELVISGSGDGFTVILTDLPEQGKKWYMYLLLFVL